VRAIETTGEEMRQEMANDLEIESLIERLRRAAAGSPALNHTLKFDLGEDRAILWDGTQTPPVIAATETAQAAETTLKLSPETLGGLIDGTVDATIAFMTGKLKVQGSMGVALKVAGFLGD
jgi:putative sterol carrier protein